VVVIAVTMVTALAYVAKVGRERSKDKLEGEE
jgi:hypothetical protein